VHKFQPHQILVEVGWDFETDIMMQSYVICSAYKNPQIQQHWQKIQSVSTLPQRIQYTSGFEQLGQSHQNDIYIRVQEDDICAFVNIPQQLLRPMRPKDYCSP
jgi:hypothetical protein